MLDWIRQAAPLLAKMPKSKAGMPVCEPREVRRILHESSMNERWAMMDRLKADGNELQLSVGRLPQSKVLCLFWLVNEVEGELDGDIGTKLSMNGYMYRKPGLDACRLAISQFSQSRKFRTD
jgi:hypothetical protein